MKRLEFSCLFVLRLWLEEPGEGKREWRGEVHLPASGETSYFRNWPMLVERLQGMLPELPEPPGTLSLPSAADTAITGMHAPDQEIPDAS